MPISEKEPGVVFYARVSSYAQRADLERQVQLCYDCQG